MIASYGHRSLVDEVHDCHYCPLGIGTVADIIAEEDCSLGTESTGLGETSGKRLPISVNIGENRNKHESNPDFPKYIYKANRSALILVKIL